jgi:hypothetical protein
MDALNYPLIEKEDIAFIHFPQHEVLKSKVSLENRESQLSQACRLGNEYKGKVRIVFQSAEGIKEVHTTIWNVSDNVVSLKGGIIIPIRCIYSVEIM